MPQLLSLCSRACEPQLLSPCATTTEGCVPRARAPQQEKPLQREARAQQKMKINKETQALNDTLNKMDLINIYRTFHPKTTEDTFFSSAHGSFSKRDHTLGHKSSLGKFKKTEIVSSVFTNHNTIRLDIKYGKKICKKCRHGG